MAVKKVTKTEEKKPAKKPAAKKATKTAVVKVEKGIKAEKTKKVAKVVEKVKSEKVEKIEKIKNVADKVEKNEKKVSEKYFYAVGRRKSSVAQVRLFEMENATDADLVVNGKKLKEYFPTVSSQNSIFGPLKTVGMQGKVRMTAIVRGGGVTGQVEAVRLGISRALVLINETLKKSLKDLGFMTRDYRKVERKKAGLKKARKSPQWSKR